MTLLRRVSSRGSIIESLLAIYQYIDLYKLMRPGGISASPSKGSNKLD